MIFNSLPFLLFLVVFLAIYWSLVGQARLVLCLVGSCFFYGWWDYRFLGLVLLSTIVDYFVAIMIKRSQGALVRRSWLMVSVGANLGILATFKYYDFFSESLLQLTNRLGWELDWPTLNLILPLGISFYTFQTLSYSIDVYRGKLAPERNWLRFATYVVFFPQLVAGPIVRASEFLPQLKTDRIWSFPKIELGLGLLLLGFFKKVVIADNIALVADHLFDNPIIYTAVNTAIVVVLYAFQIYGDFSGYSDIAIGVALMLGFQFPPNFRFPYFANSLSDFWRRWHITLSTWLRDYVYIPLGGSRSGHLVTIRNLMVTMLVGGLWHGANWTFIVWGGLHGILLCLQRGYGWILGDRGFNQSTHSLFQNSVRVIQTACVFAVVCAAWVIFRSPGMSDAVAVFSRLGGLDGLSPSTWHDRIPLLKCCCLVSLLVAGEWIVFLGFWSRIEQWLPSIRLVGYASLVWMIALFGSFQGQSFIYFQF